MYRSCALIPLLFFAYALPLAGETRLGKPVSIETVTSVQEILATPAAYLGREVRIEGEITDVCQMMGCWIDVREAATKSMIRVKVEDGEIVFPKDGAGRKVTVQGKVEKLTLTKEQYVALLEHEAEETGKRVDTSKVTQGKTIYRIRGQGAMIR